MHDKIVPFRPPRSRLLSQPGRASRGYQRCPMARWLAALAFAAIVMGAMVPAPQASRIAAWLSDRIDADADADGAVPQRGSDFALCAGRRLRNCVIDGDTIRHDGVKVRLADIDTPEVFSPRCRHEADLGKQATQRLLELINAGPIALVRSGSRDTDRYGRKLRLVTREGRSLGAVLVAEGLARPWQGRRRSWCD